MSTLCKQCQRYVSVSNQSAVRNNSIAAVSVAIEHYFSLDLTKSILKYDEMPHEWKQYNPSCDFIVNTDDTKIYVEVKSSSQGFFHLTHNETLALKKYGDNYHVFVVFMPNVKQAEKHARQSAYFKFVGKGILRLMRSQMLRLPLDCLEDNGVTADEYGPLVYTHVPLQV